MYVTNNFDNSVSVIDTTNNKVVGGPITVGSRPTEIAYDPVNKRMYVANASVNNISVIDTTKNTVVSIPVLVGAVLPH
jgi:YVTN family beta-propeller protein